MNSTTTGTRRVVLSVSPRLLSDSLATLLGAHGVDVVTAADVHHPTVADVVVTTSDIIDPAGAIVVQLEVETSHAAAWVMASPGGPRVRVEGVPAIIARVVELSRCPGGHQLGER